MVNFVKQGSATCISVGFSIIGLEHLTCYLIIWKNVITIVEYNYKIIDIYVNEDGGLC